MESGRLVAEPPAQSRVSVGFLRGSAGVSPKDAEEADEKWIGARFKKRFQARYRKRFPRQNGQPASPAELAVIAEADLGFSGWGRAARKAAGRDRRISAWKSLARIESLELLAPWTD
jgi:hypothetical protein